MSDGTLGGCVAAPGIRALCEQRLAKAALFEPRRGPADLGREGAGRYAEGVGEPCGCPGVLGAGGGARGESVRAFRASNQQAIK